MSSREVMLAPSRSMTAMATGRLAGTRYLSLGRSLEGSAKYFGRACLPPVMQVQTCIARLLSHDRRFEQLWLPSEQHRSLEQIVGISRWSWKNCWPVGFVAFSNLKIVSLVQYTLAGKAFMCIIEQKLPSLRVSATRLVTLAQPRSESNA